MNNAMGEDKRPRCRYCPRRLTDPVSVARGAGPVCYARALAAAAGQVDKPKPKPRARKTAGKGEVVDDPRQLSFPYPVGAQR